MQNCQLLHRAGVFCVGEARVLYPFVILGVTLSEYCHYHGGFPFAKGRTSP